MGVYRDRILPHLVHLSMRQDTFSAYRRRLVPTAHGQVLEVGVGSGLNLPLYTTGAQHVVGLDTSRRLLGMAREVVNVDVTTTLIEGSAEALPMEDGSLDTVVSTWTLCTIPDVVAALHEMRRVLKPSGQLLFVEHGLSPDPAVRRWQDRLTPAWKRIAGGCHLNRSIRSLLEVTGFRIEHIETGYMRGPRPMTFMYQGVARRR